MQSFSSLQTTLQHVYRQVLSAVSQCTMITAEISNKCRTVDDPETCVTYWGTISFSPQKIPVNQVPHTYWTIISCWHKKSWIWGEATCSYSPSTNLDECVDPNSRLENQKQLYYIMTCQCNNKSLTVTPELHHIYPKLNYQNPQK